MIVAAVEIDGPNIEQDEQMTSLENGKPSDSVAMSTSQVHSRKMLPPGLTWIGDAAFVASYMYLLL